MGTDVVWIALGTGLALLTAGWLILFAYCRWKHRKAVKRMEAMLDKAWKAR